MIIKTLHRKLKIEEQATCLRDNHIFYLATCLFICVTIIYFIWLHVCLFARQPHILFGYMFVCLFI
jgi:hypothetical protein